MTILNLLIIVGFVAFLVAVGAMGFIISWYVGKKDFLK